MMKTLFTLAAAALALVAAPAAAQGPASANAPLVVSYADLDLSSEAGVRALDRRIWTAVEQACGAVSDFDLAGKNQVRDCQDETLALARAQRDVAIAAAGGPAHIQLAAQH
jgi:UrcA family protein